MTGYVFCLTLDEGSSVGWQFINSHRERLKKFDYEESSIDLSAITGPRMIIDGVVYDLVRQYFERTSDTGTNRIILLTPVIQENENGDYAKNQTRRPIIYTGANSYTQRKMDEIEAEKATESKE